ncbi:hypothetical protein M6D81_03265 [Paenibacillus sp. J5C_2022]|uniref:hypothetical protein n=1 Tax=Paenibacillus sp. J5C2022 TaxID=2977129 RepID=UPI0021D216A9|nr:hypothetical protein [Paenibacillus sp. J5C2022]MCU6707719.1 hypothetical protein [Paenibacillus sp. J5C2022]
MARTYVLQSPEIAVAAARMKADANYIGAADCATVKWMRDNHVFIRDTWEGELTDRRLQQLYHRLFPGDDLFIDGRLSGKQQLKAVAYAKEKGARITLCVQEGHVVERDVYMAVDWIVSCGAQVNGGTDKVLLLRSDQYVYAAAGALALCLMHGLDASAAAGFYLKAADCKELPWYDEIAYSRRQ